MLKVLLFASLFFFSNNDRASAQSEAELIAYGRYIATAIQGCGCHTREKADGGKDDAWHYAGAPNPPPPVGPPANSGWTTPRWKRIYSRNITPDRETGIGNWTEAQFIRAMRAGITPDGRVLDPQMPWEAFQKITDRDLKALWAYLKTIKPIKHKAPDGVPADTK